MSKTSIDEECRSEGLKDEIVRCNVEDVEIGMHDEILANFKKYLNEWETKFNRVRR